MILRRAVPRLDGTEEDDNGTQLPGPLESLRWERAPLRRRLAVISGTAVSLIAVFLSFLTFYLFTSYIHAAEDAELEQRVVAVASAVVGNAPGVEPETYLDIYDDIYPDSSASLAFSNGLKVGQDIPVSGTWHQRQHYQVAFTSVGGHRIVSVANDDVAVTITQDTSVTSGYIAVVRSVLFGLGSLGVVLGVIAGIVISRAGIVPLARLRRAAEYIAATEDLRPIPIHGTDEVAQLTASFNEMLASLRIARARQAEFVADAGHELKTPLTSMRTNIELLLMVQRADAQGAAEMPGISSLTAQDRADLERDVLAQMQELSILIGDLVDLARADSMEREFEPVRLDEIVTAALKRTRRRRVDIEIRAEITGWLLDGDPFALNRAVLNVLDNAAKWSQPNDVVRVTLRPTEDGMVRLRVDDEGPGIPESERQKVFERFYRTPEARVLPGSGLGLAIVAQTVARHEGSVSIHDSPYGGARVEILLPGQPLPDQQVSDPLAADPQLLGRPAADQQVSDPLVADPLVADPQLLDPPATEQRPTEDALLPRDGFPAAELPPGEMPHSELPPGAMLHSELPPGAVTPGEVHSADEQQTQGSQPSAGSSSAESSSPGAGDAAPGDRSDANQAGTLPETASKSDDPADSSGATRPEALVEAPSYSVIDQASTPGDPYDPTLELGEPLESEHSRAGRARARLFAERWFKQSP